MLRTLNVDLSWKDGDIITFLPIFLTLICFSIYWFIAQSEKIKSVYYDKYDFDKASANHILFTKIIGFILMGVVPSIVFFILIPDFKLSNYGLTFVNETALFSLVSLVALLIIVIPVVSFNARKPSNFIIYPQIKTKVWDRKLFIYNGIGWTIYLFGYEFLFRGILLFSLIGPFGVWPAIAINVALYSATHIPKSMNETISAVPFGIVLCLVTIASGSIWVAFIVHIAMAWTNTYIALKYNPEMNYHKKTKNYNV